MSSLGICSITAPSSTQIAFIRRIKQLEKGPESLSKVFCFFVWLLSVGSKLKHF